MTSEPLTQALLLALLAGCSIPLGGLLALADRVHPNWMTSELRHGVMAFGGGVLVAAVALVLVPQGLERLHGPATLASFAAGGVVFFLIDRTLGMSGKRAGQFLAMLVDFLPEAVALGAMLTAGAEGALLLAILIALQNFPEGFNAFREASEADNRPSRRLMTFALIPLLGPLAALAGAGFLSGNDAALGGLMLFAAGGVLYLTFQDVAPQAVLEKAWGPPLGAIGGFALGLAGHLMVGG
jgi:ZIP family zinc transporter